MSYNKISSVVALALLFTLVATPKPLATTLRVSPVLAQSAPTLLPLPELVAQGTTNEEAATAGAERKGAPWLLLLPLLLGVPLFAWLLGKRREATPAEGLSSTVPPATELPPEPTLANRTGTVIAADRTSIAEARPPMPSVGAPSLDPTVTPLVVGTTLAASTGGDRRQLSRVIEIPCKTSQDYIVEIDYLMDNDQQPLPTRSAPTRVAAVGAEPTQPFVSNSAPTIASSQQETVEAAKFNVGQSDLKGENLADVDANLPTLADGYGDSQIFLLPRDPNWAYTYWDVPNEHKAALRQAGGIRLALRFYDVTGIDREQQRPHSLQQYDCDELAHDWYIPVPISDRDYIVEIGYLTNDGRWLMLARSNPAHIPPIYPSNWLDDQFVTVDWEADLRGKTQLELPQPGAASYGNSIYDRIFNLVKAAEAQRVAGSIFGSMQQVPEQALSSYSVSGLGMAALTESGVGMMSGAGMAGMSGVGITGMSGAAAMGMSGVGITGMSGAAITGMSGVGVMSGVGAVGVPTASGIGMSGVGAMGMSGVRTMSGVGLMSGVGMASVPTVSGMGMSGIGLMSGAGVTSMSGIGMGSGIGVTGMSGVGMSGAGMGLTMSGVGMSGVGAMNISTMSGVGYTLSGVGMSGIPTTSGIGMSGVGMSGVGMHSVPTMSGVNMSGVGMGLTMSGVGVSGMGMYSIPTVSGVGMSGVGMGLTMSGVGMSGVGMMSSVPTLSGVGMSGVGLHSTMSGIGMSGIGMSGVGMGLTMSGIGMSGVGFGASIPPIRPRKFWLVANAELIVHGATEPDATVLVGDREIKLSPDGTFRFQMAFPDGDINYPVLAIAADGEQTRSIRMDFNRGTPVQNGNTKEEAVEEWLQ